MNPSNGQQCVSDNAGALSGTASDYIMDLVVFFEEGGGDIWNRRFVVWREENLPFTCHSLLIFVFLKAHSAVIPGGVVGPRLSNGQLYKFSYSTEVLLDRAKGSSESSAGYRVSSSVDINLVWRNASSKDDQLLRVLVCDSGLNEGFGSVSCVAGRN